MWVPEAKNSASSQRREKVVNKWKGAAKIQKSLGRLWLKVINYVFKVTTKKGLNCSQPKELINI